MNTRPYILTFIFLTTFFTACSVDEESSKPTPQTLTGVFTDNFVASLHYKCTSDTQTEAKITDESGHFTCRVDDNISFSIGEHFYLGQTKVAQIITPSTLYPFDAPKALNLLQLLQTLDKDKNLDNGIEIDSSLEEKLQDLNITFDDTLFDSKIEATLGVDIVSSESAYKHFSQTLQTLGLQSFDVDYTHPQFTSSEIISVYENQQSISTIFASDNASLIYSINTQKTPNDSNFTIDENSGELRFTFNPDYELVSSYKVTIDVTDSLNISSKEFTINILDIDENPPLIKTREDIIVQENQLKVLTIDAEDENPLTYYISGEDSDSFELDSTTGEITFKELPDYEKKISYQLTLSVSDGLNTTKKDITVFLLDIQEKDIPVLGIIMNWSDYSQNSASLWHNKLFDKNSKSVASWYSKNTLGEVNLFPVNETSGAKDDGIIIVDMQTAHPGSSDTQNFRDTYIREAITNSKVTNSVDFAKYDTNKDGVVDKTELQILFIVAGGEESYGDSPSNSVWAVAWSFDSQNAPTVDGVKLMQYNGESKPSGSFMLFGAQHDEHTATIGVIAHELGHSMLNLYDYYDDGGGSGLGLYDLMSGGAWGLSSSDTYSGETPTQFSIFNKKESNFLTTITTVDATETLIIKCSSHEGIKLKTEKSNEYFLIACRDTQNLNSDISFYTSDHSFSHKLFTTIYHVDDTRDANGDFKHSNTEDGLQTVSNHYNVSLLEKETQVLMTDTEHIDADFNDVYTEGDLVPTRRFKLYDGTSTGFSVEILDEDYLNRSVKMKITK